MTALRRAVFRLSPEEYLAAEEQSGEKHEYVNGQVYAMSGGSPAHSIIAVNLLRLLSNHLLGKPCQPFNSDMRLRLSRGLDERFYYPDVMVVCPPRLEQSWQDDPVAIFEVSSPSSERVDHGEKRDAYASIATLREYAILDSQLLGAVVHRRLGPDATWETELGRSIEQSLHFPSLDVRLSLRIYQASGVR